MGLYTKSEPITRLKICAYPTEKERESGGANGGTKMDVMYNPESLSMSLSSGFSPSSASGATNSQEENKDMKKTQGGSHTLSFDLLFDNTYPNLNRAIDKSSVSTIKSNHDKATLIQDKINQFVDFAGGSSSGEPKFLVLNWAALGMKGIIFCTLTSLSINYTLFDEKGNALRATVSLSLNVDDWNK